MLNLQKYRYWRYSILLLLAVGCILVVGIVYLLLMPSIQSASPSASLSLQEAMSNQVDSSFTRISKPRPFVFPEDHGAHPDVKTEWWYMTGNLTDSMGRDFGYQLTFFRSGLRNTHHDTTTSKSAWSADEFYMAHFALSDIEQKKFYAYEEFSRPQTAYTGITLYPFVVRLGAWRMQSLQRYSFFPLSLFAQAPDGKQSITLTLDSLKPLVLQGTQGYSQKSADSNNASHYYSFSRIRTNGTVMINNQKFTVQGLSWFDREWSTSALARHQIGWDWFALHFDNQYELMLYRLRSTTGQADRQSMATLIAPNGTTRTTRLDDAMLTTLSYMTLRSGVQYPYEWRMTILPLGIDCIVTPRQQEQELPVALRYWEGAVRAEARINGEQTRGKGYLEMTGYTAPQSKSSASTTSKH